MFGTIPARLTIAFLCGLSVPATALAQIELSASTPSVTLRVRVTANYAGEPEFREEFSANDPERLSVLCMSGFYDVRYVLRDPYGNVVPTDNQPWKRGSDMIQGGGGYVSDVNARAKDACTSSRVPRVYRAVLLSDYYPNLKHGTYTLEITLAPRGTKDRASLPPITIKV